MKKLIIIGLDGVPFGLIQKLSSDGVMPNTQKLLTLGIFKKMESTIPEVSSVAWSSIITGENPGSHGVFGFTDFRPFSYEIYFPNFNTLKTPTFWEKFNKKSILINIPSTYPVKEMNGVHISGFVSIELVKSVYPKSLIPKLKEMDYRLDVDSSKAHSSMELFLEDIEKTLNALISTYRYLWENYTWEIFMLVFTTTDRLLHFLWVAQEKNHKYYNEFIRHFQEIDRIIGEIANRIDKDDVIIILSDHGFGNLEKHFNINFFLKQNGFLKLEGNGENYTDIGYETKAFALDPGRIYINLESKYPKGSVPLNKYEETVKEIIDIFSNLKIEGKKVIRDVYRKHQIYNGKFIEQAPDIILVGNDGFNLKANIKANQLYTKDIFTGKHTQDDAFFFINTHKNSIPEKLSVCDVFYIIEKIINEKIL